MKTIISLLLLFLVFPVSVLGWEWRTVGFYRAEYNQYRDSAFNPGNRSVELLNLHPGPHLFFSQYLSLQGYWKTVSWQVDIWGQAKLTRKEDWGGTLKINQLFVQMDLWDNWVFIAGRSLQRWGTGYAFNPTDVLAPEKELRDPDNTEKRAVGNDMLKLEYFGENFSFALCCFTQLRFSSRFKIEDGNLAFRLYKNLWDADFSIIALFKRREHPVLGINYAYVIGEKMEIHGEFSAQRGSNHFYHPLIEDPITLYQKDPFMRLKKKNDTIMCKYLLGFQYTFFKNILWIMEYYHQDQGYSQNEWHRTIDYVHYLDELRDTPLRDLAEVNILWALKVYSSKGTMRDYCLNHLEIPLEKRIHLSATVLTNMADFSSLFIPQLKFRLEKHFTFYARSFIFLGKRETEFGEFFNSYTFEAGLRFEL